MVQLKILQLKLLLINGTKKQNLQLVIIQQQLQKDIQMLVKLILINGVIGVITQLRIQK